MIYDQKELEKQREAIDAAARAGALWSMKSAPQVAGPASADHQGDAQSNQGVSSPNSGPHHRPAPPQVAGLIDNAIHRALFSIPPTETSLQRDVSVPVLPTQSAVTGDREVDTVLWLRKLIKTGNPARVAWAMEVAECIKTPPKELEKRYTEYLKRTNPGNVFATFAADGFAEPVELARLADRAAERATERDEAFSRFGDAIFEDTPAETFCKLALARVPMKGPFDLDIDQVDARFANHPKENPATLADCLHELGYWDKMYAMREAVTPDTGEGGPEIQARTSFVFRCMGRIPPRTTEEAHAILHYLEERDCMNWTETPAILKNLMTQQVCQKTAAEAEKCRSAAQTMPGLLLDNVETCAALVKIAHDLIGEVPLEDATDDERMAGAGFIGGVTRMCMSAMEMVALAQPPELVGTVAANTADNEPNSKQSPVVEGGHGGGERAEFAALDAGARQAADAAMAQAAVLQKLDGYMAASGYDEDHPWRREIAKVVAIRPAPASHGNGPDLSGMPDMQRLRVELLKGLRPVDLERPA